MGLRRTTIGHLDWDLLMEGLLVRVRRLGLTLGLLLLLRILVQGRRFYVGNGDGLLRTGLVHRNGLGPVLLEARFLRERMGLRWRKAVDGRFE